MRRHAILTNALSRLPHGPEFRFLDRLIELEPGRSGVGEYIVPKDLPCLRGHFPDDPLFPGVLLVEAGAQLAGVIAQSDPHHKPWPGLKLTALGSVKILDTARPGDVVRVESVVTGRMGKLIQAEMKAFVKGKLVMQGNATLSGSED
jgi:3-hydroxyacyl-[acyl-carrier-protein] dehydratase